MRVFISAGDPSGDIHAGELIRSLRAIDHGAEVYGLGGGSMAREGARILYDPTRVSAVGIAEALGAYRVLKRVFTQTVREIESIRPDVVVYVDFPGFNLRLAEAVHRMGIPSVYFFAPTAWAWGKGRAGKVARTVDTVISVFPFEADVYRAAGADVEFVGHPVLDELSEVPGRDEARAALGLPDGAVVVGLLPGSRSQEVERLAPVMGEAAARIASSLPGTVFAVPVAPSVSGGEVERLLRQGIEESGVRSRPDVRVMDGRSHLVMASSDVVIVASGTATLEAACIGIPMVILYKLAPLTYALGKLLVKIPDIGLPNILAGRRIVPELIQDMASGKNAAAEALRILRSGEERDGIRKDLADAVQKLGPRGALGRAARLVVDLAHRGPAS